MSKYFMTAFVALCWVPGAASATSPLTTVACGETVTHSIRLANDLINCPGEGLVVGADGITVDLAGHTVAGDGLGGTSGPDVGIRNPGHGGVTIEDGTVRGFDRGVRLEAAAGNHVRDLTVLGIAGRNIELVDSTANRIDHNTSSGSPRSAIALVTSDGNLVEDNKTARNHVGVLLGDGSQGNRVQDNAATDADLAGLDVEGSDGNTLVRNRLTNAGVILIGDDNVVVNNHVADIAACEDVCFGISMEGGSRNLVAQNAVIRVRHIGIRLDSFEDATTVGNVIRDNVVRDASDIDIAINPENVGRVLDTLVEGNVAIGAGDDGINVAAPDVTLRTNRAVHNSDLGIEAVPGVTDGGGNVAAGNGNPLQCTNVFCK